MGKLREFNIPFPWQAILTGHHTKSRIIGDKMIQIAGLKEVPDGRTDRIRRRDDADKAPG